MELVISTVGKMYRGKVWGLRSFSLDLKPGVLGLLGPGRSGTDAGRASLRALRD
jgi:ABC-type multidrug transport system ATPase subunit